MPDWYQQPNLTLATFFVLLGFCSLIKGADFLVGGSVLIAKRFRMTPAVIGATVVAFGTSLPELVVSVGANLKALEEGLGYNPNGPAAIAVGNIVGSNIFNIGAILGISALIVPIAIPASLLKRDYPIMVLTALLMIGMSYWGDGTGIFMINRIEGCFLVFGLGLFTLQAIKSERIDASEELESVDKGLGITISLVILGIVMLAVGGEVSLTGAIAISKSLGMSERVIGLTIMAIGTSLPELATSIQAAKKGHHDIAVANVVGSNLFNVLSIVGFASLIIPLSVSQATMKWDYPWMLGFSLALLPIFYIFKRIERWMGILLILSLLLYLTLLITQNNS